jgi:formylglycine-generating enzyme required for sulfatase activity
MLHCRLLSLLLPLIICCAPLVARGEHRVALLIGNSQYEDAKLATPAVDLQVLATALDKYGVRSTVLEDLPGDKLTAALDTFTNNSPTRGTALVYFSGQVLPGNFKGQDGTFLAGINAKSGDARSIGSTGYSVEQLLARLHDKGGASAGLVLLHAADPALEYEPELPPSSFLGVTTAPSALAAKLTGRGDLAAELRAACSTAQTTLDSQFTLTGRGTPVVSPPDNCLPGQRAGDEWVNARGMVFCWCPPGKFVMGSPASEPHRYPDEQQQEVSIDQGFWIGKYELTLRENLRGHPGRTIAKHKLDPLTMIHLDDGRAMLKTYTADEQKQGRLPSDWEYALPTETQWEYAARAGTSTRWYFGENLVELPRHANFGDKRFYDSGDIYSNAAHRTLDDGTVQLALVGSYRANPWGLHDVYGNVAEWCVDTSARGGSWVSVGEQCRSAYRDRFSNRNEQNFLGYRVIIQPRAAE